MLLMREDKPQDVDAYPAECNKNMTYSYTCRRTAARLDSSKAFCVFYRDIYMYY